MRQAVKVDLPRVDDHPAVAALGPVQRLAVAGLPHLDREVLAREHRRGEPGLHRGEPGRVGSAERVEQGAAREPVRAQPVQDRSVEPGERRERRIGVQRVAVARQPVDEGLFGTGRVGDGVVGVAVGRLVLRTARPRSPPHPPSPRMNADITTSNSGSSESFSTQRAMASIDRALALVPDRGHLGRADQRARHRDLAVQVDLLLAVDEHRRVERADRAEHRRRLRQHDGHGRKDPLVDLHRVLGGVRQFESVERILAAADADGVEQRVLRAPTEDSSGAPTFPTASGLIGMGSLSSGVDQRSSMWSRS